MKKILIVMAFMLLGGLMTLIGYSLAADGQATLMMRISDLEDQLADLESPSETPLEGPMIAVGAKYMLVLTLEDGIITKLEACDLVTGECELDDTDGLEEVIWYENEYILLQMALNDYLLERERTPEAPEAEPGEE